MKRFFFLLLPALMALSLPEAVPAPSVWPDGSPVDGWFSRKPAAPKGRQARKFVITRYGAVHDSTVVQTAAIQKAIDAAAARGGTVVIPEGVWLSGALFFKPGTHLLLQEGAVLKGSTDIADFPDIPVHIEGVLQPYVSALVNADCCDGFSIRGGGTLNGSGAPFWDAFWARRKENPACTNLEVRRPRLVGISRSSDVTIEGVRLRNAAFWNIHLYKCRRVYISGVDVYAPVKPVKAPSSDGIDLDGCEDVHIIGCTLATGDDLIALKGGKGPWADESPDNAPDARVLVEDCRFGHGPGAIVFGSECVKADNIILRNSTVKGTGRLLWLKMRPDTPQNYSNILLENIKGKVKYGIYVKPWTQFFDLKGRKDTPMSYASNVEFRRCTLTVRQMRRIVEAPDQYELKDIVYKGNKYKRDYNRDEKKVKPYTLPDPLVFADGTPVASPEQWSARRQEILGLFQKEMYGVMPPASPVYLKVLEEGPTLDGAAVRRQVRMTFSPDGSGPHIDWLLVYPRDAAGPVPAILMLNYYGNHTILDDKEIIIPTCWLDDSDRYGIAGNRATEAGRGVYQKGEAVTVFPFHEILSRGYVFATACYGDVAADPDKASVRDSLANSGCCSLWAGNSSGEDNTGALMAWGWALCRGMDMLEKDGRIDASKVVVTGSSRLAKAAMLASAFDDRFAVTVLNQTGGGGVPLAKRNFGEYVASQNEMFPHWWCRAFSKYSEAESKLPFDQHMLLGCIAPRPLLVEGFNQRWFDTKGEFLSLQAASPVWRFLGGKGLPDVSWPGDRDTSAIGPDLGYVRRSGGHGIDADDWNWMLDFADRVFKCKNK
jgi:hypothetical protein